MLEPQAGGLGFLVAAGGGERDHDTVTMEFCHATPVCCSG